MKNQVLTLIVSATLMASPVFAMEDDGTSNITTHRNLSPAVKANESLKEIDVEISRLKAEKGQFKRMGATGDANDHSQKIHKLKKAKIDIEIVLLEAKMEFFVRKGAENDACKCHTEIQKKRRAKSLLQ